MNRVTDQHLWKTVINIAIQLTIAPLLGIAIALTLFTPHSIASTISHSPILIAELRTTPFEEQPATLISPREGAAIPLYIRPAPNQQPVGYGISGDPVTITDQFGDYLMEDDPSATWSHIRLNNAPYTEGWLRGRFLSTDVLKDTAEAAP